MSLAIVTSCCVGRTRLLVKAVPPRGRFWHHRCWVLSQLRVGLVPQHHWLKRSWPALPTLRLRLLCQPSVAARGKNYAQSHCWWHSHADLTGRACTTGQHMVVVSLAISLSNSGVVSLADAIVSDRSDHSASASKVLSPVLPKQSSASKRRLCRETATWRHRQC